MRSDYGVNGRCATVPTNFSRTRIYKVLSEVRVSSWEEVGVDLPVLTVALDTVRQFPL